MAVLGVRRYGDPVLRRKAEPVSAITPEIKRLIADMVDTMYHHVGIGIAAPQIGVSLRLIILEGEQGTGPRALVNPTITAQGGWVEAEEGCLSLPGIFAFVERAEWLEVQAMDAEGQPIALEARGLLARAVQHELDHLDGVLFIDRLDKATRDWIKRKIKKEGLPDEAPHHAFAL